MDIRRIRSPSSDDATKRTGAGANASGGSVAVPHRLGRHVEVGMEPRRDVRRRLGPGDRLAHLGQPASRSAGPMANGNGASAGADGRARRRTSWDRPSTGPGTGSAGGGRRRGRAPGRAAEAPDRRRRRRRTGRPAPRRTASRRRRRTATVRSPTDPARDLALRGPAASVRLSGRAARTCPRSRPPARRPSRPPASRRSSGRRGRPSTAGARP